MFRSSRPVFVAALLGAACLDTTGSTVATLPFNFTDPASGIGEGWVAAVADVPADRASEVDLAGDYSGLPAPFSDFAGVREAGTTVSGNLFVFHKKWIQSPWTPGDQFRASLDIVFLSDIHQDCTGGPGSAVIIKAGASGEEPMAISDGQGILRFNLDKGTGESAGDFVQLGNIRNGLTGCPAEATWQHRGTIQARQNHPLTIDPNGGFWIFFGTQSSFAGRHDIYILQVRIALSRE